MSFFDAENEQSELNDFTPLPAGTYHMCVTDMDMKEDQHGIEYIAVTYEVCDGDHKNRKLFDNIYLTHEIESLQKNSRAKLKLLCQAKNIKSLGGPSDLAKFIGLEVWLKVDLYTSKKKEDAKPRNIINKIAPYTSNDVPEPQAVAMPASKAPWG